MTARSSRCGTRRSAPSPGRSVVVVAAPIPLPVPRPFEAPARRCACARSRSPRTWSPRASQMGAKAVHDPDEEKSPARRFRRGPCADAVDPVIPVAAAEERQAVRADGERLVDRAHAVLVERGRSSVTDGCAVRALLAWLEDRRRQEWHRARRASPHRRWSRGSCATANGSQSRSSEHRERRPAAARLVPPVLDVAFDETAGRPRAGLRPRQVRTRAATAPSRPAADRGSRTRRPAGSSPLRPTDRQLMVLIEQPAIHQEVEGVVGRPDDGPRESISIPVRARPPPRRATRRPRRSCHGARSARACASSATPSPSSEDALTGRAGPRARRRTCSAAHGFESRAEPAGELRRVERRRDSPASRFVR